MEQRVITILGGTGFLGRYVVKQLANSGYRIRVVARNANSASELKTSGDVGHVTLIPGNITDPSTYSKALKDSYAVINLVGILFEKRKQTFTSVQAQGAEKLAAAAKAAGVERFIHVSALGVTNENGSNYARSKYLGEMAVLSAFKDATILRPSVIFGAEDNFYNKFAKLAAISPALPLIGGGKTLFQPVYVGDVANAIEACLSKPETKGQAYELGGQNVYNFKDILKYILSTTDKKRCLVSLPFGLAGLMASIAEFLPSPPLTLDQVKLLKYNSTVSPSAKNLSHLGIKPTSVEAIVPTYLSMYYKK